MVIPPFSLFGGWATAKFPSPEDERALEKPLLVEVFQQGRDRAVGFSAVEPMVGFQIIMGIPGPRAFVASAVELNEADASLHEPSGEEAVSTKVAGDRRVEAVGLPNGLGFLGEINGLRRGGLHPVGEFIRSDTGLKRFFGGVRVGIITIPFLEKV